MKTREQRWASLRDYLTRKARKRAEMLAKHEAWQRERVAVEALALADMMRNPNQLTTMAG